MKKKYPRFAYHEATAWNYLVGYSTLHPRSGWDNCADASCFGSLKWGTEVAIQFRVPTRIDDPHWAWSRFQAQRANHKTKVAYMRAANAYLEFVVKSPFSPWRAVMAEAVLVGDRHRRTGVYFPNCDYPRPLMHNAFIAIRWAWEHPTLVLRWYQLQKKILPTPALYYCQFTGVTSDGKHVIGRRGCYHTWTDDHQLLPMLRHMYVPPLEIIDQQNFSVAYTGWRIHGNKLWTLPYAAFARSDAPKILDEFKSVGATVTPYSAYGTGTINRLTVREFNRYVGEAWTQRMVLEGAFLEKYNIDGTKKG